LLFKAHDIDFTPGPTFGDVTGHEEVNALPHDNSVFHSTLKLVPWDAFNAAVEQHATRVHARGFRDKSHLVAMLYKQFAGTSSLREIAAGLHSHASRLYHLGARPPRRSPMADRCMGRARERLTRGSLRVSQKNHARRHRPHRHGRPRAGHPPPMP
jgi:hypothetical protein